MVLYEFLLGALGCSIRQMTGPDKPASEALLWSHLLLPKAVREIRRYAMDAIFRVATHDEHVCESHVQCRDEWAYAQEGALNISAALGSVLV